MRLGLSTTAWGYVIALPVLAVLSATYMLWHTVGDAIGYRQVVGQIVSVDDLCAPGTENPQYSATTMWHHCTTAEVGYAALDESGHQTVRKVVVDVRYTSPVDNRMHDKKFTMGVSEASRNHFVGKADMVDAVGPVMASLSQADDVHYDKWTFSQPGKSLSFKR